MVKFFSTALLLSLLGSSVLAQELPNRPSLTLDEQSAWVVTTTRVSRQLNLNPAQKQKVDAAFARYDQGEKAIFSHGAATDQQMDQLDHTLASQVLGALTDHQRERLHQIALQLKGPFVLAEPPVAREVGLSSAEEAKIRAIVIHSEQRDEELDNAKAKAFFANPRATQAQKDSILRGMAPQELAVERKKRADQQAILNLLTPDQRRRWIKMLGEHML